MQLMRKIYAMDMDTGKEGDVDRFPTPEKLWNNTFGRKSFKSHATNGEKIQYHAF